MDAAACEKVMFASVFLDARKYATTEANRSNDAPIASAADM
jgi:hypothetical protein